MRPFAEMGVDMAGPFLVKHGRTRANIKIYSILFVCCATRAVNIEAEEDASTESCRMAFERLCSRYGNPERVYSDNGKNFVGLNHSLQAQYEIWIKTATRLKEKQEGIEWCFTPPYSPRWNGHVEAGNAYSKRERTLARLKGLKSLNYVFSRHCQSVTGRGLICYL